MPNYHIVFSDVDGTLLNSRHCVPEDARTMIQALNNQGVPFVLVSSRSPAGMLPIREHLGVDAPMVCFGGALILDEDGGELKSTAISLDRAVYLKEEMRTVDREICSCAYSFDHWIVDDPHDYWIVQEQQITGVEPVRGTIPEVLAEGRDEVHKLLCMGEPWRIEQLEQFLRAKYQNLSVFRSKDTYLEIMDLEAKKSRAVKHLCRRFGILLKEAVAFGDNFNDLDMLQVVGMGIAMGNAPDAIKAGADAMTLSNDEGGMAAALEKLNFTLAT